MNRRIRLVYVSVGVLILMLALFYVERRDLVPSSGWYSGARLVPYQKEPGAIFTNGETVVVAHSYITAGLKHRDFLELWSDLNAHIIFRISREKGKWIRLKMDYWERLVVLPEGVVSYIRVITSKPHDTMLYHIDPATAVKEPILDISVLVAQLGRLLNRSFEQGQIESVQFFLEQGNKGKGLISINAPMCKPEGQTNAIQAVFSFEGPENVKVNKVLSLNWAWPVYVIGEHIVRIQESGKKKGVGIYLNKAHVLLGNSPRTGLDLSKGEDIFVPIKAELAGIGGRGALFWDKAVASLKLVDVTKGGMILSLPLIPEELEEEGITVYRPSRQ